MSYKIDLTLKIINLVNLMIHKFTISVKVYNSLSFFFFFYLVRGPTSYEPAQNTRLHR